MTFLQVINSVLRQLRESEVSTVTANSYSKLIAQFINQVIEEMSDIRDWHCLVQQVNFTVPISEGGGILSDDTAGANLNIVTNSTYLTDRSSLCYDTLRRPIVYDVTDTAKVQMYEDNVRDIRRDYIEGPGTLRPNYFGLEYTGTGGMQIWFNSLMDKERNFEMLAHIPQEDLSVTSEDDVATTIYLPTRPIIMGALYYAYNERGEEMGEPGGIAEQRYQRSLASAIENDDRWKQDYLYRYLSNDEMGTPMANIFPEITETAN